MPLTKEDYKKMLAKTNTKSYLKKMLKERFEKLYPGKRLCCIQLDGFSHHVYFDDGKGSDRSTHRMYEYTPYAPELSLDDPNLPKLFEGVSNCSFQNNAMEIVYVEPGN